MQSTIRFNAGGVPLEISSSSLLKYPESDLYKYTRQSPFDEPIFLDVNPFVFLTVLDYLRTDQLFIPRNVSTDLVRKVFSTFRIPFPASTIEVETEIRLPTGIVPSNPFVPKVEPSSLTSSNGKTNLNSSIGREILPPAYEESSRIWTPQSSDIKLPNASPASPALSSSTQNSISLLEMISTSWGKEVVSTGPKYTQTLDTQNRVIYKKLEQMIFSFLLPLISSHVDASHMRLRIYILPPDVPPNSIANDTEIEDAGFPKEYFTIHEDLGCPSLSFLTQPKVMELLQKILQYATGIQQLSVNSRNMTIRIENYFGLYESKSLNLVIITMHIPPNCAF